ncbi:hypothetical protein Q8F55_008910 [Vanrija albida]|uniref:RRM domain-containing protein n=1 Tax=Vanrija albida TaxID=181172 RepID=A0ABR3PS52_9TREE
MAAFEPSTVDGSPEPADRDLLPTAPQHSDTASSPSDGDVEPQAPRSPTSPKPKAAESNSPVATPEVTSHLPPAPPAPFSPPQHNVYPGIDQGMPSSLGITFQGPPPMLPNGSEPPPPTGWQAGPMFHMANGYVPYPALPPGSFQDPTALAGDPESTMPRPHPFIASTWGQPIIFLSSIPPAVHQSDLLDVLQRDGITSVSVNIHDAVPYDERVWPDVYYDWMPRNGTLQFHTMYEAEKALSLLHHHPYLAAHLGILVSPFPPPNTLPESTAAPRFIRPLRFAGSNHPTLPTEGQVYDLIRSWGAIREVSVTLEVSRPRDLPEHIDGDVRWRAKVVFWHDDEATKFETEFQAKGLLVEGWLIDVRKDPSYIAMAPTAVEVYPNAKFGPPLPPLPNGTPFAQLPPLPHEMLVQQPSPSPGQPSPQSLPAHLVPLPVAPFSPSFGSPMVLPGNEMAPMVPFHCWPHGPPSPAPPFPSLNHFPSPYHSPFPPPLPTVYHDETQASDQPYGHVADPRLFNGMQFVRHPGDFAPGSGQTLPPQVLQGVAFIPPSPPPSATNSAVPWSRHNKLAGPKLPMSPPQLNTPPVGSPQERGWMTPKAGNRHLPGGRNPGKNGGAMMSRAWTTGIVDAPGQGGSRFSVVPDGNTVIPHGGGQYIPNGPGSSRPFQPIDFCNLLVKNLDSDINGHYLGEMFNQLGRVTNARVMRDDQSRSRGYGFVSFMTASEAAHALEKMNGAQFGNQRLVVQYHQPRNKSFGPKQNRRFSANATASEANTTIVRMEYPFPVELTAQASMGSPRGGRFGSPRPPLPFVGDSSRSRKQSKDGSIEGALLKKHNGDKPPQPKRSQTELDARLRAEIARIDPTDAGTIMAIMKASFQHGDLERCLESKAFLVTHYGTAKKMLARHHQTEHKPSPEEKGKEKEKEKQNEKENEAHTQPSPPAELAPKIETRPASAAPRVEPSKPETVAVDKLSLATLSGMSAESIINAVQGPQGDALLKNLGVVKAARPDPPGSPDWTHDMASKPPAERKVLICRQMCMVVDNKSIGGKSRAMKIARDIVNSESNEHALIQLVRYPAILQAKFFALAQKSFASASTWV